MNNMSMKEYCVSASEKCVCTRRSEANKILRVVDGENAQLVRLRTKDDVFIVWLYDGEEETLFYPVFKIDDGKLPDVTEILAADEIKPDTAFFCYRNGEYYYLFAEGEEKDEDGLKYKDISDTEIMQIVVFANERMIWQIFSRRNYPEIPSNPIIKPYLFEVNGEYKPFGFVQINVFWRSEERQNSSWCEKENLQRFWNFTISEERLYRKDSGKVDETTLDDVWIETGWSIVRGIFIPVFWEDNIIVRDNSANFFKTYETVKYDDMAPNKIVIDKAFKYNDNYWSFSWNDTQGLFLNVSKKQRLYFLNSNGNSAFFKVFNECKYPSAEELSFRHYLMWNDEKTKERIIGAFFERHTEMKKQKA